MLRDPSRHSDDLSNSQAARDRQRERERQERAQMLPSDNKDITANAQDLFHAPVKVKPSVEDQTSIEVRKSLGNFERVRQYMLDNGTLSRRLIGVDLQQNLASGSPGIPGLVNSGGTSDPTRQVSVQVASVGVGAGNHKPASTYASTHRNALNHTNTINTNSPNTSTTTQQHNFRPITHSIPVPKVQHSQVIQPQSSSASSLAHHSSQHNNPNLHNNSITNNSLNVAGVGGSSLSGPGPSQPSVPPLIPTAPRKPVPPNASGTHPSSLSNPKTNSLTLLGESDSGPVTVKIQNSKIIRTHNTSSNPLISNTNSSVHAPNPTNTNSSEKSPSAPSGASIEKKPETSLFKKPGLDRADSQLELENMLREMMDVKAPLTEFSTPSKVDVKPPLTEFSTPTKDSPTFKICAIQSNFITRCWSFYTRKGGPMSSSAGKAGKLFCGAHGPPLLGVKPPTPPDEVRKDGTSSKGDEKPIDLLEGINKMKDCPSPVSSKGMDSSSDSSDDDDSSSSESDSDSNSSSASPERDKSSSLVPGINTSSPTGVRSWSLSSFVPGLKKDINNANNSFGLSDLGSGSTDVQNQSTTESGVSPGEPFAHLKTDSSVALSPIYNKSLSSVSTLSSPSPDKALTKPSTTSKSTSNITTRSSTAELNSPATPKLPGKSPRRTPEVKKEPRVASKPTLPVLPMKGISAAILKVKGPSLSGSSSEDEDEKPAVVNAPISKTKPAVKRSPPTGKPRRKSSTSSSDRIQHKSEDESDQGAKGKKNPVQDRKNVMIGNVFRLKKPKVESPGGESGGKGGSSGSSNSSAVSLAKGKGKSPKSKPTPPAPAPPTPNRVSAKDSGRKSTNSVPPPALPAPKTNGELEPAASSKAAGAKSASGGKSGGKGGPKTSEKGGGKRSPKRTATANSNSKTLPTSKKPKMVEKPDPSTRSNSAKSNAKGKENSQSVPTAKSESAEKAEPSPGPSGTKAKGKKRDAEEMLGQTEPENRSSKKPAKAVPEEDSQGPAPKRSKKKTGVPSKPPSTVQSNQDLPPPLLPPSAPPVAHVLPSVPPVAPASGRAGLPVSASATPAVSVPGPAPPQRRSKDSLICKIPLVGLRIPQKSEDEGGGAPPAPSSPKPPEPKAKAAEGKVKSAESKGKASEPKGQPSGVHSDSVVPPEVNLTSIESHARIQTPDLNLPSPPPPLTPPPTWMSYFEKVEHDEDYFLHDQDVYLLEAKRLKHKADKEVTGLTAQTATYLEAGLYFILTGITMERSIGGRESYTMYRDTLNLIRYIGSRYRNRHEDLIEAKLMVLSLRCQSMLALRLYKLKQAETKEAAAYLTEYFVKVAGPNADPTAVPPPMMNSPQLSTPSPHSPTPTLSPAGSTVSLYPGHHHPSPLQQHQNHLQPNMGVNRTVYSKMFKQCTHSANLMSSHDLWESADALVHKYRIQDFFISIERLYGPLTLHNTLVDLVRYVKYGLKAIKETMELS